MGRPGYKLLGCQLSYSRSEQDELWQIAECCRKWVRRADQRLSPKSALNLATRRCCQSLTGRSVP